MLLLKSGEWDKQTSTSIYFVASNNTVNSSYYCLQWKHEPNGTDDTPCKHIHLAKQQMDISTKVCVQFDTRRGVDAFTFALVCDIWSHIFEIHWYSMTGNVWWFRFTMCFTFGKCTISISIYGCSIYLIRKLTNRIIKAMICIQMSWNHQSWIVVCWHSLFVRIILLETVNLHLYLSLFIHPALLFVHVGKSYHQYLVHSSAAWHQ